MRDEYDGLPVPHGLTSPLNPLHHLLRGVAPFLGPSVVPAKAGEVRRHAAEAVFQVGDLGSPGQINTTYTSGQRAREVERWWAGMEA